MSNQPSLKYSLKIPVPTLIYRSNSTRLLYNTKLTFEDQNYTSEEEKLTWHHIIAHQKLKVIVNIIHLNSTSMFFLLFVLLFLYHPISHVALSAPISLLLTNRWWEDTFETMVSFSFVIEKVTRVRLFWCCYCYLLIITCHLTCYMSCTFLSCTCRQLETLGKEGGRESQRF